MVNMKVLKKHVYLVVIFLWLAIQGQGKSFVVKIVGIRQKQMKKKEEESIK